jgi:hypothetical protein
MTVDVVHPDPDAVSDALGAMNGDDVWMPDARQRTPVGQGAIFLVSLAQTQQLQSDDAIKAGVARPIDLTEAPLVDCIEDLEWSPARARRKDGISSRGRPRVDADFGEYAEAPH